MLDLPKTFLATFGRVKLQAYPETPTCIIKFAYQVIQTKFALAGPIPARNISKLDMPNFSTMLTK